MKILKILILLILSAIPAAADYADSLALLQYAKSIKSQTELLRAYKTAESFADLRIWYLRQMQPKIFVELETADNATDMGYFRLDFYRAGKIEKLSLIKSIAK